MPGAGIFELSSNCYAGAIHPHGYHHLDHVRLDPFPIFTYCIGDLYFEKQIFMVYGQNTTVITYGPFDRPVTLVLRPARGFPRVSSPDAPELYCSMAMSIFVMV